MAELTSGEIELVRDLRSSGVLQDTTLGRLDVGHGLVAVICGDGDQSHDVLTHLWRSQTAGRGDVRPRVHILGLNGAPLYVTRQSPAEREGLTSGEVLRRQVGSSIILKGIDAVALIGHAPCGHANTCGIGILDELVLLQLGKRELMRAYPSVRVAAFFHVDFGLRGRKRTYFVDRDRLEAHIAKAMFVDIAVTAVQS